MLHIGMSSRYYMDDKSNEEQNEFARCAAQKNGRLLLYKRIRFRQVLLDYSLTVHLPQQTGDEAKSDQCKTVTAV